MPQEVRCILFDRRETHAAVGAFLSSRGQLVDSGMIQQVDLEQRPEGVAALVTLGGQRGARSAHIQPPELLAAVLLFCSTRRIPLPHLGQKSVESSGGNIVLVVTTAMPEGLAESDSVRLGHDETARRIAMGVVGRKAPGGTA